MLNQSLVNLNLDCSCHCLALGSWFQLAWKAPNVGGVEIAGFDLKSAKPSDSSNVVLIDCLYCVCLELSQLISPLFVQIEWLCEEMLPNRRYED